jgi:hypothetical protein
MKTIIKAISFLFGAALIAVVIWLGFLTANNQSPQLVAVFGIASALVAPIGLALIGYVFTSNDPAVINRLAKVPEIEKLIAEANSQEEKIRLLEKQKEQLAEIIQFETRRQSLINRKEANQREAIRLLDELKAIEEELSNLNITLNENVEIAAELEALRERIDARQHGDIIFAIGGTSFRLDAKLIRSIPSGWLIYDTLQLIKKLTDWVTAKYKQLVAKRNHEQNSQ